MSTPDAQERLDELAEDYLDRCRRGEAPRIEDYCRAHPELADQIRDLFPTIAAMEDLKTEQEARNDRAAWRGPRGNRLGDFRLIRELGRGGMGVVFEAEQESLGRRVAVKILPRPALLRGNARERFEREARTAAKLHHTNIVPVFGVGHYQEYHFLVMQYIDGMGLDEILRALRARHENPPAHEDESGCDLVAIGQVLVQARVRRTATSEPDAATRTSHGMLDPAAPPPATEPPPSDPRALTLLGPTYYRSIAQIGLQVAEALEYAHGQGTLHRDIKPGNLLLDGSGTVWVADFGLAKAIDQDSVTRSGDFVGTLRYMAPEQFEGQTDPRSDIYSLGLTLYELLTLRPAFADTVRSHSSLALGQRGAMPPHRLNPGIPRDLDTIVQKAIAHHRQDRYASAADLALDLRLFLEERPIRARRITPIERLWRWSRRNRELAGLLAATTLLLLTIVGLTSYGYVQAERATERIRAARDREVAQRKRAEATSELAVDVLERIFAEFTPTRFAPSNDLADEEDETAIPAPTRPVLSPQRAQMLTHLLGVFQQLAALEGEDLSVQRKAADAHRTVADIQRQLGHFEQARASYAEAAELFARLAEQQPLAAEIAINAAALGAEQALVDFALGDPHRAFDTLLHTLDRLRDLPAEFADDPLARYERARTLYLLARHARGPDRPDGPPRRGGPGRGPNRDDDRRPDPPPFERPPRGDGRRFDLDAERAEAVALLEDLVAEYPEQPEYRHLLARCDTLPRRRRGFEGPAEDGTQRGIDLLEQLVADFPDVPEYQLDLAEALVFLAPRGRRESDVSMDNLARAAGLVRDLIRRRPDIPDYERMLVRILDRTARLHAGRRSDGAAEQAWGEARAVQRELVARYPDIGLYTAELANLEGQLGGWLARGDRPDEAADLLRSAVEHARAVQRREPDFEPARRLLGDRLRHLIEHERRHGMETAAEYLELLESLPPPRRRGPSTRPAQPDRPADP